MRYLKWLVPILLVVALLLIFGLSMAGAAPATAPPPTPGFDINWDVVSSGETVMHSSSFILVSTSGQPAIGNMSSASFKLQAGYWGGVWPWRNILLPFLGK